MITVPEATKKIVERSRYLSEALAKDIINLSSLARYIKPELEQMLIKDVSSGSIIMALKRLQKTTKSQYKSEEIFIHPPEMTVRSGLFFITLTRTKETEEIVGRLFLNRIKGTFSSITIGATEIQIAGAFALREKLLTELPSDSVISNMQAISQITVFVPGEAIKTPGVYYFFLKSIAWEGINIIGASPTKSEFTLFFEDKNVNRAFEILSSLFTKEVI